MSERKQFNVKLPAELYDRIGQQTDNKTEFAIEAFEIHLRQLNADQDDYVNASVLAEKDARIRDLQKQLDRLQDNYSRLQDAFSFVGQKLQPANYEKPKQTIRKKIKGLLGSGK